VAKEYNNKKNKKTENTYAENHSFAGTRTRLCREDEGSLMMTFRSVDFEED
jgi:hypothetical protein